MRLSWVLFFPFLRSEEGKLAFWIAAVIWKVVLAVVVDMRTITLRFNRTYPAILPLSVFVLAHKQRKPVRTITSMLSSITAK